MALPGLLIFDCDGVLIDSEVLSCRVDSACLAEIGIELPAEAINQRYVGISTSTMLADIADRSGRTLPADFPDRLRLRLRLRAAFEAELTAIAGVAAVLADLTLPVCVASSSEPARLQHSLGLVGLWPRFAPHVFSATQVPRGKPAPDLFLFAAARMGVPAADCLVIEDSVAGVQAARAAGMRPLGFVGGSHCGPQHAARLREAGADRIFADMHRLPALLGVG